MKIILPLLLGVCLCAPFSLSAQYLDVSYPASSNGLGAYQLGLGYYRPFKFLSTIHIDANFSQLEVNKSEKLLNVSVGIGRVWWLNTPMPAKIWPIISIGYYTLPELTNNPSGMFFGVEVDYYTGRIRNFSIPIAYQRYGSQGLDLNLFTVGIRYHISNRFYE
jgi:hypothetical protein